MKETYHGSCHCGGVRFVCGLDLSRGTSRCNCSVCRKARFWKAIVVADDFRLVRGDDLLTDYTFGGGAIHHLLCRHCGIKPFGRGYMEEVGGTFYAVNVACLDDATDAELAGAPVRFEDGAHDDWERPPGETRFL